MIHTESRRVYRTTRQETPAPFVEHKLLSNQTAHTQEDIVAEAPQSSDGGLLENACSTSLTLEEIEALLPQEYDALPPWTARKLCLDYGVRDLPNPDSPGSPHLKMVAPIAEELVHDTILLLWEKAKEKTEEFSNASHVRGWLKKAIKFAILQWVQKGAREYEKQVYALQPKDEEQDSLDAEIIEPWDATTKKSVWHRIESVFDRAIGHCPTSPSEQEQAVSDEIDAALQLLPLGLQTLIHQVYREQMSWKDAGAGVDIESKTLEREVHRWLRTLRPYIPSYQLSKRWVRDTRRARKSFHCPECDKPMKRQKGNNGGGCVSCQMRIHKDQFVIKYYYHV